MVPNKVQMYLYSLLTTLGHRLDQVTLMDIGFMTINSYKTSRVQKFALKLTTHQWDTNYDSLLELVDVPKLCERRSHLKLAQVYKLATIYVIFQTVFFRGRQHTPRDWLELTLSAVLLLVLIIFTTHLFLVVLLHGMLLMMPRCAPLACPHLNVCFVLKFVAITSL